jgi:hypothetical protein
MNPIQLPMKVNILHAVNSECLQTVLQDKLFAQPQQPWQPALTPAEHAARMQVHLPTTSNKRTVPNRNLAVGF